MTSAPAGPQSLPCRPRFVILGLLMLLMTAAATALAPAALAHGALVSSNPVAGSVVPAPPGTIELVFNQDIKDFQPKIAITITGHDPVEIMPTVNGPTVSADLTTLQLPGRDSADPLTWRVGYRVVSADGHPIAGSVTFTLTTPGPTATAAAPASAAAATPAPSATVVPTAAPDDGGGAPVWPWVVGAIVLVGGGVVAALRLGRG